MLARGDGPRPDACGAEPRWPAVPFRLRSHSSRRKAQWTADHRR
jgi:hypothetical protein